MKELDKLRELVALEVQPYDEHTGGEMIAEIDALEDQIINKGFDAILEKDMDPEEPVGYVPEDLAAQQKFDLLMRYMPEFSWAELNHIFKVNWKRKKDRKPLKQDYLDNPEI